MPRAIVIRNAFDLGCPFHDVRSLLRDMLKLIYHRFRSRQLLSASVC